MVTSSADFNWRLGIWYAFERQDTIRIAGVAVDWSTTGCDIGCKSVRANEREAFMMRIDYERTDDRIERTDNGGRS